MDESVRRLTPVPEQRPRLRLAKTVQARRLDRADLLVERQTELAAIDALATRLSVGTGGAMLIDAPAGFGKTTLLDRAARQLADKGGLVRHAAPAPQEREFPFGAMRSLLEVLVHVAAEREQTELLDGPAGLAASMLLRGTEPDPQSNGMVAHSAFWLCAAIAAKQPLVLILDDAQWADRASLEVLAYLARRAEELPLLIAVGARSGDPRAHRDLLSLLGGVVLHPRPLSRAGAAHLIRRLVPDTPIHVCSEIHRGADGNPWLIAELAGQSAQPGVNARKVIRRRLAELTARDRAFAAARAVAGNAVPPHVIAKVAGITLAEAGAADDALATAGLPAHELIARTIADDLVATERERLHRAAARALRHDGARSEIVAEHLLHCRPRSDGRVTAILLRAAAEATSAGWPSRAVEHLQRALEERAPTDNRSAIMTLLSSAAFDAGHPNSVRWLRHALSEASTLATRGDALTHLAARGVFAACDMGVADLLSQESALVSRLATRNDPVLRRALLAHRAWLERDSRGAAASAAMATEALEGGFLLREATTRSAYHLCIAVLTATDHFAQARQAIAALRSYAAERGSVPLHVASATHCAELALRTGQIDQAEAEARAAIELAGPETRAFAERATHVLVGALTERGEFEEARALLAPDVSSARLHLAEGDFERVLEASPSTLAKSVALAYLGHREQAVALAETELASAERFGAPVSIARALLARALAEDDDETRVALCQRGLSALDATEASLERARLRLELGRSLAHMGQRKSARDALRPALAEADASGATLLARRARRALVATGLRPRRAAMEGPSALTPRQREICELAARGKGNRAIAQQLFLSIKTVETHLAAGYRKLGVTGRAALAASLAD